jgi:charged multivesicular body protein 4
MMNKLFGKAKQAPPPSESIQKLRETLDMLEKREKYLEKKIVTELDQARKLASTKNRRAALMALKRKKIYEGQVEKLSGARMTLEVQIMTIENATTNYAALDAMKTGANALKNISRTMTIEDVEDTMEDIREQMDIADEIGNAIAQPLGADFDEDELNAELDALEQEKLDAELSQLDARAAQCKTRSIFVHVNYTIANNNKNSHILLFV